MLVTCGMKSGHVLSLVSVFQVLNDHLLASVHSCWLQHILECKRKAAPGRRWKQGAVLQHRWTSEAPMLLKSFEELELLEEKKELLDSSFSSNYIFCVLMHPLNCEVPKRGPWELLLCGCMQFKQGMVHRCLCLLVVNIWITLVLEPPPSWVVRSWPAE